MSKTAVGLFKHGELVSSATRDIENLGFPPSRVQAVDKPLDFGESGALTISSVEFEVDLMRELMRIGAAKDEAEAYVDGVRRGGILVFVTGPDEKVDKAADVLNRYGASEIEALSGAEPQIRENVQERVRPEPPQVHTPRVQTGRIRQAGGGATVFVW